MQVDQGTQIGADGKRYPTGDPLLESPDPLASGHDLRVSSVEPGETIGDRQLFLVDASGGAGNITLPAPAADLSCTVKKVDASGNAVTIVTPGSETIDGAATKVLSAQNATAALACDGTDWWLV